MTIVAARKFQEISRSADPKKTITEAAGDLSKVDVFFNHVLIGIYARPEKTKGGIILTDRTKEEDIYQGKVGLVLKKGPDAFADDDNKQFGGQTVEPGDWIVFRVGDGWSLTLRDTPCRMIQDTQIKIRLADPEIIF